MNNKYAHIYWSEADKVFIARATELDGVVTHGKTYAQAAQRLEEAIELHLGSLNPNEYRYGQFYINKESGQVAEVLDSWIGKVWFLVETADKDTIFLSTMSNNGLLYFEDEEEASLDKWEYIGEI